MAPTVPEITKCPKCTTFFWIGDVESVVCNDRDQEDQTYAPVLGLKDCIDAIAAQVFNNDDREFFLRHMVMKLFNDRIRAGRALYELETERKIWKTNLEIMYETNCNRPERLWLCAEIKRNLGEFEACASLLNQVVLPDDFSWIITQYERECSKQNTIVFELKE